MSLSESTHQIGDYRPLNPGDEESEFFLEMKPKSDSQILENKRLKAKMELSVALRRTQSAHVQNKFQKIPWDEIKIDGDYSIDDMKEMLQEIIKATGQRRTLKEIMNCYKKNHMHYDRMMNPERPKLPKKAYWEYFSRNSKAIKEEYIQKFGPGHTGKTKTEVYWCFGMEKYKALPEHERKKFEALHETNLIEYKKNLAAFYKKYPHLRKDPKNQKKSKPKVITPFKLYHEEINKVDTEVPLGVAQIMWRNLPMDERAKYIEEVLKIEGKDKLVSRAMREFLDRSRKPPEKPGKNVLSFFKRNFKKTLKANEAFNYMTFSTEVQEAWEQQSEAQLQLLNEEYDKAIETWKKEIIAYIKKQPVDLQAAMYAKYKPFQGKRKASEPLQAPQETKKTKTEDKPAPIKVEKVKASKIKPSVAAESQALEVIPSSIDEPVYPSQFTAHYFMKHVFKGRPSKIAKAYAKLDPLVKRSYREEMKQLKKTFLIEVAAYIKSRDQADVIPYQMKMKSLKAKQQDEINWHTSTDTDDEQKTVLSVESSDDTSSDESDVDVKA